MSRHSAIIRINARCERRLFRPAPQPRHKESGQQADYGLVIANQNSKALRSSTYVLMLMGLSFYKASVVLHARAFDTVRKFEPGTFPPSCSRQKIRFEKEQSGNGGEKSGN